MVDFCITFYIAHHYTHCCQFLFSPICIQFEKTADHLFNAACRGQLDDLNGKTEIM